jgi:hypothetical protein
MNTEDEFEQEDEDELNQSHEATGLRHGHPMRGAQS